ncbi:hypothetical protein D3C81_1716950 [compost metagenome]
MVAIVNLAQAFRFSIQISGCRQVIFTIHALFTIKHTIGRKMNQTRTILIAQRSQLMWQQSIYFNCCYMLFGNIVLLDQTNTVNHHLRLRVDKCLFNAGNIRYINALQQLRLILFKKCHLAS